MKHSCRAGDCEVVISGDSKLWVEGSCSRSWRSGWSSSSSRKTTSPCRVPPCANVGTAHGEGPRTALSSDRDSCFIWPPRGGLLFGGGNPRRVSHSTLLPIGFRRTHWKRTREPCVCTVVGSFRPGGPPGAEPSYGPGRDSRSSFSDGRLHAIIARNFRMSSFPTIFFQKFFGVADEADVTSLSATESG